MKNYKRNLTKFISRIVILVFLLTSVNLDLAIAGPAISMGNSVNITLDQVRNAIKEYYIEPVSDSVLNSTSIKSMVEGLNDPYSEYFTKEEYESFMNSLNMRIYGIGIHVQESKEGILVSSILKNSPSEEVGLRDGDIIVEADRVSLAGMAIDEAINYITGDEGTFVHIKVKRESQYLDFDVERREIKLPSAEGEVIDDHIGYISIQSFGIDTEEYFEKSLEEMESKKVDSYIIDLRYNGGGYMRTALEIAGHFIGDNVAINIRDNKGKYFTYNAVKQDIVINKPVIFLINEYSASASEILSAALKDYDKAFFIGNTTYGKGVAQLMFNLIDGSMLKLTTEEFFSPKGHTINKVGITPDIKIEGYNSLYAAKLLLAKKINKVRYLNIQDGKWNFNLDLDSIKKNGDEDIYKAIIDNLPKGTKVSLGSTNKGTGIEIKEIKEGHKALNELYYDYNTLGELNNVPSEKSFTITFSSSIDVNNIKENQIRIVDAISGEKLETKIEQVDKTHLKVIPVNKFESNKEYYLIINKELLNTKKKSLKEGVISKFKIKDM